jgi:hypothetical protein
MRTRVWLPLLAAVLLGVAGPTGANAACCYFSAQNADILQPAQKVFLTWDPVKQQESFTVQPKFEGNALDFGMVIPTPTQPKLHEMPRDFFKHLAVYSILMRREFPQSKLLPRVYDDIKARAGVGVFDSNKAPDGGQPGESKKPTVVVLEQGVVGSLDYKIIEASRADDLYKWLKDNKYHYAGDEAALNFYVQKKWLFTVMKIDTMQMKKNKDGSYAGEVTPTRFSFSSDDLVYPLKITQISVKDKTEALFYVQAPTKVDLPGDKSYQYTWVPMLQSASSCNFGGFGGGGFGPGSNGFGGGGFRPGGGFGRPGGGGGGSGGGVFASLPGGGSKWLEKIDKHIPNLLKKGQELDFTFQPGQRPQPNKHGRIPTTVEWARKLTEGDVAILQGKAPYCEIVPNVDEGFNVADLKDEKRAQAVYKVIQARLAKAQQQRPNGYLVREAPNADVAALQELAGHLQAGLFITKFRKTFTRDEMNDDLLIVPARLGDQEDTSEYQEILPTSPP